MVDTNKTVGGYIWGAPIWPERGSSAKARRTQIIAHLGHLLGVSRRPAADASGPEPSSKEIDDYIFAYHSRLTDKSAALLQTVAVIAAIEGVFVAQAQQAGGHALAVAYAALGAFGVCALCLMPNLLVFWPRWMIKEANGAAEGQSIWRNSMIHMVQKRTWKHQLAVCMLGAGILLCAWDRASAIAHWWPHDAPPAAEDPPIASSPPAPAAAANAVPTPATPEPPGAPSASAPSLAPVSAPPVIAAPKATPSKEIQDAVAPPVSTPEDGSVSSAPEPVPTMEAQPKAENNGGPSQPQPH